MSVLAGLSPLQEFNLPIIVDLADIIYRCTLDPRLFFQAHPSHGGIALAFPSQNPQYSYLRYDETFQVLEAAEKRVISDQASAGTYIFRDTATLLVAIAEAIKNETTQTYNDLFYVCPLFNGVLAQGRQVFLESVTDVLDIKSDYGASTSRLRY